MLIWRGPNDQVMARRQPAGERIDSCVPLASEQHYDASMPNDRELVQTAIRLLQDYGIEVWLFGGWAEELHGLSAPPA